MSVASHLLAQGDARRLPLRDGSVHCVVTSPPYHGLRDYGTARWLGGDPECAHAAKAWHGPKQTGQAQNGHASRTDRLDRQECFRCGAQRVDRQIGLEESPDEFVATMVGVFREVWRVLRDDGTVWLNLGDSYCSTAPGTMGDPLRREGIFAGVATETALARRKFRPPTPAGLKPKDLCLIPERVALALQADGWTVRAKPPWVKAAPMPESVTDRPTVAHESIFLLSKRANYFFDGDAVRVSMVGNGVETFTRPCRDARAFGKPSGNEANGKVWTASANGRNRRTSDWFNESLDELIDHHEAYAAHLRAIRAKGGMLVGEDGDPLAFRVTSQGFPGAHFATFPRKLVEPMIRSSTSEHGVCPECGGPWERVTERSGYDGAGRADATVYTGIAYGQPQSAPRGPRRNFGEPTSATLGWHPTCPCNAGPPTPAVVLDPFSGASTTGVVALALGRSYIGFDLSRDYLTMARRRLERPHAPVERPSVANGAALPLFAGMEGLA